MDLPPPTAPPIEKAVRPRIGPERLAYPLGRTADAVTVRPRIRRAGIGIVVAEALSAIAAQMVDAEQDLGRIDAVAGDGDHGRGMVKGTSAAAAAATAAARQGAGTATVLTAAGEAWAAKAAGTSGVLWGAALAAAARPPGGQREHPTVETSPRRCAPATTP